MTVTEWSFVVIAVSAAVIAVATILIAARAVPLLRRLDDVAGDLRAALERVQRIAADLEAVSRDARHTEARVSNAVNRLLDQAEPPLRVLTGALAGVRAGLGALVSGRRSDGRVAPPSAPP